MKKNTHECRLWDPDKIGTIILSHYRCGTHFLHDYIVESYPDNLAKPMFEISDISVISSLNKSRLYPVAICNFFGAKIALLTTTGRTMIERWHVVRLTRRDKIAHFISYYFWFTAKFGHNNTPHDVYEVFVQQPPTHMPIENVQLWLQEQMIINYLPYHTMLDYDDLCKYEGNISWTPNRYQDIELRHLFTNHEEISDLLTNFTFTVYP